MSWQDDQDAAFSTADDLGIERADLQSWHDESSWTWADIADRLEIQAEYASYFESDSMPPQELIDAYYEYEDWDDYPDWVVYYHEK